MKRVKILADMNISPVTVRALNEDGWNIVRVSDHLPVNTSDRAILRHAREAERVVRTQDLDFSALLATQGNHTPSLVTLRLSDTSPAIVTERLKAVLPGVEDDLREGAIVIIQDRTVRVRALPIQ